MTLRTPLRSLALISVAVLAACSPSGSESSTAGAWESEITTTDDVTTVRTMSGSVWRGVARLEEELSIGVESGEDAYMFGNVSAVAQHGDEIFVLDRQIPAVRVYDLEGRHLRDLGREGQGPGELLQPEAMVVGADGRIYLRDPRNGRIMILDREGNEAGVITIRTGFQTSTPMVMTTDGTLYNSQLIDQSADVTEWVSGYVPLYPEDATGREPILPPAFDVEPARLEARREGSVSINNVPFSADSAWAFAPSGVQVAGVSTDYTFDILYPDGKVIRVIKSWEPVPVDADEAAWQRKLISVNMARTQPDWTWNGPPIPEHKPAYASFLPDLAGRIWVRRPGPGYRVDDACIEDPTAENFTEAWSSPCWRAEYTWEVFDDEGRFLGGVDIPSGVQTFPPPHITEDHFLTEFMDDLGTIMVKRYRIVRPGN